MTTSYTPTATKKTTITKFETTDPLNAATTDNLPHEDLADWLKYVENIAEGNLKNLLDINIFDPFAPYVNFEWMTSNATGQLEVPSACLNMVQIVQEGDQLLISTAGATNYGAGQEKTNPLHSTKTWSNASYYNADENEFDTPTYSLIDDGSNQINDLQLDYASLTLDNTDNGVLYWDLYNNSGNYTFDLYKDSAKTAPDLVGRGYALVPSGSFTIFAVTTSGITGTVDISYTANDTGAANKVLIHNFWGYSAAYTKSWGTSTAEITIEAKKIAFFGNTLGKRTFEFINRQWGTYASYDRRQPNPEQFCRYSGMNYSLITDTYDSYRTGLTAFVVADATQVQDDDLIAGQTSGVIGKVFYRDTVNNRIYCRMKGIANFSVGENIVQMATQTAAGTTSISSVYEDQSTIFGGMLEACDFISNGTADKDFRPGVYLFRGNWTNTGSGSKEIKWSPSKFKIYSNKIMYAGCKMAFLTNGQLKITNENENATLYNASFVDAGAGDYDILLGTDYSKASYALDIISQEVSDVDDKFWIMHARNTAYTHNGGAMLYFAAPFVTSDPEARFNVVF